MCKRGVLYHKCVYEGCTTSFDSYYIPAEWCGAKEPFRCKVEIDLDQCVTIRTTCFQHLKEPERNRFLDLIEDHFITVESVGKKLTAAQLEMQALVFSQAKVESDKQAAADEVSPKFRPQKPRLRDEEHRQQSDPPRRSETQPNTQTRSPPHRPRKHSTFPVQNDIRPHARPKNVDRRSRYASPDTLNERRPHPSTSRHHTQQPPRERSTDHRPPKDDGDSKYDSRQRYCKQST